MKINSVTDKLVFGIRLDFRNILTPPRKRNKFLDYCDALSLLMTENLVVRVDPDSVFDWVYTACCQVGGERCPSGETNVKEYCMQKKVEPWLTYNNVKLHLQLSTFVGSHQVPKFNGTYLGGGFQWIRLQQSQEQTGLTNLHLVELLRRCLVRLLFFSWIRVYLRVYLRAQITWKRVFLCVLQITYRRNMSYA